MRMTIMSGMGEGIERGLNCRRQKDFINTKNEINNKDYPVGENRQDSRTGQDRTGQDFKQGNIDDELARDCKHKEIIKGANEEGNEKTQVGQINQ